MTLEDIAILLLIFLASFIPTVVALIWLRSGERGRRERWEDLFFTFAFGAVVAVIMATAVELAATMLLDTLVVREYGFFTQNPTAVTFLVVIVIAPVVEEFAKLLGVFRYSRYIWRPRNGLVFGAAAGLGFASTENFLFESTAYFQEGLEAFLTLALVRSFSSALMHASATSISGYGVARSRSYGGPWWPYYVAAVAMHASFNIFASFGVFFSQRLGPIANGIGLAFSLALVIFAVLFIRWRLEGFHP